MVVADATVNREHPACLRVDAAARSAATWLANSRVGVTTSACGAPGLASWGSRAHPNHDPLQQSDTERQGLARTRTRLADHVGASQRDRNGHGWIGNGVLMPT